MLSATMFLTANAQTMKKINIVCAGNSLTANFGTRAEPYSYPQMMNKILGGNYVITNSGVGGQTTQDIIAAYTTQISNFYNASTYADNLCIIWEGRNDLVVNSITYTQAYNNMVTLCGMIRATGFKIIIVDITPSWTGLYKGDNTVTGYNNLDADRIAYNALVAANWQTFAEGYVALGSDPFIGTLGQNAQAGYVYSNSVRPTINSMYQDGTHFVDTGYGHIASKIAQAVLNMY